MARTKKAGSKVLSKEQHVRLRKAFLAVLEAKRSFDAKIKKLDQEVTSATIRGT